MTATAYLSGSIGTPQQQQAIDLANQTIAVIQQVLQQQQQEVIAPVAVQDTISHTAPENPIQTSSSSIAPAPIIPIIEQPKSMKSITIFNPYSNKGTGREYSARSQVKDEQNYIILGLIVRDDSGNEIKNVPVTITATDASQNKTLNGTGDIRKIYIDGIPKTVPYYEFYYEFKTPGDHTITFTAEELTTQITLSVSEDNRPN